jgi:uncharacterized protein YhfF
MATIPQKYENAERWAFGDTEQGADDLLTLVLDGTKTATCAALDEDGVPQVGDAFVVVNGRNEPVCAVELTDVELKTFDRLINFMLWQKVKATGRWLTGGRYSSVSLRNMIFSHLI